MDVVDVSNVSPQLFVTGAILILLAGTFLSLGVLRLFQLRKRQGIAFLALGAVCAAALIWSANTWLAE